MIDRVPPTAMAKKLARLLRPQHPDYHYLKKVFQQTRALLEIGAAPLTKRLPELLTDAELVAFYDAVWHAHQLTHVVMLKLLLFTGIRNAELVRLRLTDIDLQTSHLRITQGRGTRIATSSFPRASVGNSPSTWNASGRSGRHTCLNRRGTVPTRHDGCGSWSNSTPWPPGLRSASIPICSAISCSHI